MQPIDCFKVNVVIKSLYTSFLSTFDFSMHTDSDQCKREKVLSVGVTTDLIPIPSGSAEGRATIDFSLSKNGSFSVRP